MRRLVLLLPSFLLLLAAAFTGQTAYAKDYTVTMERDEAANPESGWVFSPAELTINVGDTVIWQNSSAAPHTATSNDDVWSSGNIAQGDSFTWTFETVGEFGYFCEYHAGQVGRITVQEAAAPGDTGDDGTDPDGDDGTTPTEPPDTGGGGIAPTGGVPVAPLTSAIWLVMVSLYALLRGRH